MDLLADINVVVSFVLSLCSMLLCVWFVVSNLLIKLRLVVLNGSYR